MEKRFWLGIILLVLILGLGFGVSAAMTNIHAQASAEFEEAAELSLRGDFSAAVEKAQAAYRTWTDTRKFTASVADHSPMDDVERLFAEMEIYAKTQEKPHFAACCQQLSILLQTMYDAHRLTWWNFL